MNAEEFRAWLEDHEACSAALDWLDTLPDQSLQAAWEACPRADWMIWLHEQTGTPFEVLAPVVFAAVNRALKRAALLLDKAGVEHDLAGLLVTGGSAKAAAWAAFDAADRAAMAASGTGDLAAVAAATTADRAARAAAKAAARAARATARAADAAWATASAVKATSNASAVSWAAEAVAAATKAERPRRADDCRELLEMPVLTMESAA